LHVLSIVGPQRIKAARVKPNEILAFVAVTLRRLQVQRRLQQAPPRALGLLLRLQLLRLLLLLAQQASPPAAA
jgi:hypothetical protein